MCNLPDLSKCFLTSLLIGNALPSYKDLRGKQEDAATGTKYIRVVVICTTKKEAQYNNKRLQEHPIVGFDITSNT